MITPRFEIEQDDDHISVKIYVPNCNLQSSEVTVLDKTFLFIGQPYFLRIYLPHPLKDSESSEDACSCNYDADTCSFIFKCKKEVKGQFFPGLDMLTSLLTKPSQKKNVKPKIEVLSSVDNNPKSAETIKSNPGNSRTVENPKGSETVDNTEGNESVDNPEGNESVNNPEDSETVDNPEVSESVDNPEGNESVDNPEVSETVDNPEGNESVDNPEVSETVDNPEDSNEEDSGDECLAEQSLYEESSLTGFKYGFANLYQNIPCITDSLYDVLDLKDPRNTSPCDRKKQRIEAEDAYFNPEDYCGYYIYPEESHEFRSFSPPFLNETPDEVKYTQAEKYALLHLPRKELLVEDSLTKELLAGLVSLLLSWCYNLRVTGGEECSESAWNYAKLAPQLCWFDTPCSVHESVVVFVRRALTYPLIKHFDGALLCQQDTTALLKLGKKRVLKCLLEMRKTFLETENYYLLNDLYLTDYCVWVQTLPDTTIGTLAQQLQQVKISKEEVGYRIALCERLADECSEDEEARGLADQMDNQLTISNPVATADDSVSKSITASELVKTDSVALSDDSSSSEDSDDDDDSSSSDDDSSSSEDSDDDSSEEESDGEESLDSDDDPSNNMEKAKLITNV